MLLDVTRNHNYPVFQKYCRGRSRSISAFPSLEDCFPRGTRTLARVFHSIARSLEPSTASAARLEPEPVCWATAQSHKAMSSALESLVSACFGSAASCSRKGIQVELHHFDTAGIKMEKRKPTVVQGLILTLSVLCFVA